MRIRKIAESVPLPSGQVIDSLNGSSTTNAPSIRAVNDRNTYSTGEKIVGYWIDGKPIYRKYMEFNVPNTGNITLNHNLSIDTLVNINAQCTLANQTIASNGYRPMPQFNFSNSYQFSINTITTNQISFVVIGWQNNKAYIIFEYTKTTD